VAVYVDDMRATFGNMVMCHMIADSVEELNAMADKIGVQRKWFQAKPSGDHYDIAMSKRKLAVKHGAVEITQRQCAGMCLRNRTLGYMGDPETAEEFIHVWHAVADL
jgi:hypothetical protein